MSDYNVCDDAFTFIYVHKENGTAKALNCDDAAVFDVSFDRHNWHHTATINSTTWLEYLLKHPRKKWLKIIDKLLEKP
jgi:hypothetical protein